MAKQISYVCVAATAYSEMEASRFITAATLFILAGSAHTPRLPPNTDRGRFLRKGRKQGGRQRESYCISPSHPPDHHGANLHEQASAAGGGGGAAAAASNTAGDQGPCAGITIPEA